MNKIITNRGCGKTTNLIFEASKTKKCIVCLNKRTANFIKIKSYKMKLNIIEPITHQEFIDKKYLGKRIDGFMIDDSDLLLENMSNGIPIDTITLTI